MVGMVLLTTGMASAVPQHSDHSGHSMKTSSAKKVAKSSKREQKTIVGFISDSHCGLKHVDGMGDEKSCTLRCVKGGSKFTLADRAGGLVYKLDKAGQAKAHEFAGQQVKVTGRVTGKRILVTKIEAVS
ncbi:hypothetical protein BH18ACI4_BH18ACI4_11880 [soil metagenome]